MGRRERRFALVERRGYRETELAEADDLEELAEMVGEKAGLLEFGGEE